MTVLTTVLGGVAVLTVAIVAGCYVDAALVLLPAQRRLTGPAYVEVEQANTTLGTVRYRILLATAVGGQLLLLTAVHDPTLPVFGLTVVSMLLLIGTTALITVRKVVPINRLVHTWRPADPPPNWEQVRERWHRLHRVRTVWVVLALVLQLTGVLVG